MTSKRKKGHGVDHGKHYFITEEKEILKQLKQLRDSNTNYNKG
jgi:predicted NAD/FAD-dependent oxidoreductase